MKTAKYLYDIEMSEHLNESYHDVIIFKIHSAQVLLNRLVRDENMKDSKRISEVGKAIKFNEKLLAEAGMFYTDIHDEVLKLRNQK